jgi:hypothetical protein
MTGRLASRAAEAEALLVRFNAASEAALAALARGDHDALTTALDVREALQQEIDRAIGEIAVTRARFAPNAEVTARGGRVVDRAVEQYCEPLEELVRAAQALQVRLEAAATQVRDGLLGEIASLESAANVATRYTAVAVRDPHRLDVML